MQRFNLRAVLLVCSLLVIGWVAPASAAKIIPVTSPGGIKAWLVNEPSIPMISVEMAWRGGAALDPDGREGLANMVSGLLDEGAGDMDSAAFQARLEDLAVSLSFDADMDHFYGKLRTLTKNRDEAFALLAKAITKPRFDAKPVERIRRQIVTGLLREERDPGTIARRTWFAHVFPGHPYGRPTEGEPDSVKAITTKNLHRFAEERLARDNLVIAVVGDISPEELAVLLDKTFGALPAKSKSHAIADITPPAHGSVTVVDKEIPQSVVVFGQAGIKRSDSDWQAAYVMNYVLGGGGFTSRLMEEVREKRGLAYSVYSYLYPFDHAGLHMGGVGTKNERAGESLAEIRDVMRRVRDEGITAKELADAKTYLNGSFPLRLSSNASIARLMLGMQLEDLGIDYLERRPGLVDAVTLDDVKRVAKRLLKPDNLIVVVVGQPQGIVSGG